MVDSCSNLTGIMGTRRERILQRLNPKLLKMTPKLSGDAGSFIDLNSDDTLEDGAKNLMMRFFRNQDLCEKNKRSGVQNVTELTISRVKHNKNNEICELISERLTLPLVRNDEDDACDRPGKRLQKLKMELQEKMSAKWEEEYKKRVIENKVYSESKHKLKKYSENDDGDGDGDDDDDDDDDENIKNGDNSDSEKTCDPEFDEEKVVGKEIDEEQNSDEEFGDDEEESDRESVASSEQNNENNCKDHEEIEPEEYDGCSLVPAYQPGGGMLYGGSELTQTDEGLPQNLLSPSLRLSMNESSGSKLSPEGPNEATPKKAEASPSEIANSFTQKNKLFSQVQNDCFDLNEAFEFCSGKFPDTVGGSQLQSQNQIEENIQDSDNDESQNSIEEDLFENDQSNDEEDTERETSKSRKHIIAFEDSEGEEEHERGEGTENNLGDTEELHSGGPEILSDNDDEVAVNEKIKKKKKRMNLHFSDDEEDATKDFEEEKGNESDDSDVSENEEEDDEHRSVHYDSEENEIINPKEFFEKEAELSGSEWSGDEDERGLDEFDLEEGDADKLDDDQVRSQLEKIHIRRVLDDDAREVRLIQEILFEDGDLHSDGKRRDRKFKWKNLGAFDEQGNAVESKEEGGNSSEDDGAEEEEMRKIRHEKELFLMTKKKDGDLSSDEEIVEDFHAIKVTSVKTSIKLSSASENTTDSSKIVTDYTKTTKSTTISQNVRGSFLTRNEQFLSRLAKTASSVTDNILGPKSSKNFVFATKSPEKKNPDRSAVSKRQMEDSEICSGRDKRLKILPPEIDTGPSILDFLV